MTTQTEVSPPNNGGLATAVAGDWSDDVREIGDRIAALNETKAIELAQYLESLGVLEPPGFLTPPVPWRATAGAS